MKIVHGRADGQPTEQRGSTFTGVVWADPVLPSTDGVMINSVVFTPAARTFWHRHGGGQVLQVTGGGGWVATRAGDAARIRAGDTVWIPPGEEHWHGADRDSYLAHTATSLGTNEWLDEVTEEQYDGAIRGAGS